MDKEQVVKDVADVLSEMENAFAKFFALMDEVKDMDEIERHLGRYRGLNFRDVDKMISVLETIQILAEEFPYTQVQYLSQQLRKAL